MELALILTKQILMMFLLMFLGVCLFRKKKISMQGSKELGSILLYCVIPIIIIKSFWVTFSEERVEALVLSFLVSILILVLAMLVSYGVYGKSNGIANFAASFSNAGFIGIPLVQATVGDQGVFYIASFIALLNLLQWTYGVFVMDVEEKKKSILELCKNPIVISCGIGLFLFFARVPQLDLASSFMSMIGALNTPLAMLITGVYLAQVSVASMVKEKALYGCALLRLVMIPLLSMLVLWKLPIAYDMKLALLIAASAPTGSNIAIFAQLYHKDYMLSVKLIVLTTIGSVLSLPALIALADTIF